MPSTAPGSANVLRPLLSPPGPVLLSFLYLLLQFLWGLLKAKSGWQPGRRAQLSLDGTKLMDPMSRRCPSLAGRPDRAPSRAYWEGRQGSALPTWVRAGQPWPGRLGGPAGHAAPLAQGSSAAMGTDGGSRDDFAWPRCSGLAEVRWHWS